MKRLLRKPKTWLLLGLFLLGIVYIKPVGECELVARAANGNLTAVKVLLALGVDPNTRMTGPGEAVTNAAGYGHTAVVLLLLSHGADPNSSVNEGETALAYAAGYGHTETVRLLLAHGADPNWGCLELTPLIYAREMNHPEIIKILKQAGEKE